MSSLDSTALAPPRGTPADATRCYTATRDPPVYTTDLGLLPATDTPPTPFYLSR